jgi:hypothetical protein
MLSPVLDVRPEALAGLKQMPRLKTSNPILCSVKIATNDK